MAEQIAKALDEELLYLPDLIREGKFEFHLKDKESIGFCFPTHGWQPPRIIRHFFLLDFCTGFFGSVFFISSNVSLEFI